MSRLLCAVIRRLSASVLVAGAWIDAHADPCAVPASVTSSRIVPIVRGARAVAESFAAVPASVPTRELNSDLTILFAEDTSGAISYFQIPPDELACWRRDEMLALATANLAKLLPGVRVSEVEPKLYLVVAGGNYEASLILAPGFLIRAASGISGKLLIGLPSRDVLLVTGTDNTEVHRGLRDRVDLIYGRGDRALSDKLFVIEGRNVSVYER